MQDVFASVIRGLNLNESLLHFPAGTFPTIRPIYWLTSHFAVGGYSPLQRLSGMLTAHMTQIAPYSGFTWHPHRGLEIYTYVISGTIYHEDTTGGQGTITAGEVQRMFSGDYIEHQELNLYNEPVRVIQIWFAVDTRHRGLEAHYEQVKLGEMAPRLVGDGLVREIIGPAGATTHHVEARLNSTIVPAGGQTTVELPQPGEDLFLYVVNGNGYLVNGSPARPLNLYDVILATPTAHAPSLSAGPTPLNFLSFYLPAVIPNH